MGAAASKKLRYSAEISSPMAAEKASEVSGPVAMITFPSGISVTSPSRTVMSGWLRIFSVISAENRSRSTARAPPAATAVSLAQGTQRLPSRSISALSSPAADSRRLALKELEQISSAKSGE